jgi:hypothetical protein
MLGGIACAQTFTRSHIFVGVVGSHALYALQRRFINFNCLECACALARSLSIIIIIVWSAPVHWLAVYQF